MKTNLSTGAGVVKALKAQRCSFSIRDWNERAKCFEFMDWDLVPDPKYQDRFWAVHKETGEKKDLSHYRFYVNPDKPLWEPIDVPPFYTNVPEGEILYRADYPIGTRLALTEDANYFGGNVWPKGTVIVMVGYKTVNNLNGRYLRVEFEPCAQFPDNTYRSIPSSVVLK